jgi:acyl-CoA thioesterase YciA
VRKVAERRSGKAKTGEDAEFTAVNERPSLFLTQHDRAQALCVRSRKTAIHLKYYEESRVRGTPGMIELEQEDPIPQGDLALQITALPRETNGFGDIFGGWLVAQMDLAGTAMASKVAGGRVATVAIDRMAFLVPVAVGAQLSFYTQALEIGRSSIQMMVEVWSDDPLSSEWRKVTEAVFVFVAIDGSGRTRSVPPRAR